jgi:dolichyl-diphosphooligosaccharide--protein glycosyltransferase/undecaprenyl-diphosphooligosaccharide--protein glycosyltransferase
MSISQNKKIILYIIIAFAFSFATRLIWVNDFKDTEQFKFNNEFMINTNDGYIWAEGARDILAGSHQENDLSPVDSAASILTAMVVKILPFQFETIIFYMPAFLGSLLVIPLILIGQSIQKAEVGFIAALIASIANSYYNRTMVGYYDTDMLNIVLPTILLWSLIWAIRTKEDKYILFMALDIVAYRLWYPQSYSLEFAFFGLIGLYVIYQYFKKEDFRFNFALLTFMMFAMMGLDGIYRVAIVLILFGFMKFKNELFIKYLKYIFLLSLVLFFVAGGFDLIWNQLKAYVFKDAVSVTGDDLKLHFYTVAQTVREAGQISFTTFSERISGHTITFLASLIGYIWLSIRFPIMLLGLPLVGLGFLALFGGLRFTVYAVPVMGLGIGFLIVEFSRMITDGVFSNGNKIAQTIVGILLTISVLVPNINHVKEYKVPTVFSKDEVVVLDKLKSIATREDYVVGWWDYGYPIRYYADVKTLSDGGKHSGEVNFPTSFALTNPQDVAAKMIRLDVEYTEKKFALKENEIDKNRTNIASMTLNNGFKDTNDFLLALSGDIKMLPKTRDVYLFLPNNMLNIYPTVKLFSNLDLMSGMMGKNPFFYKTSEFSETAEFIELGNGVRLSKKDASMQVGQNSIKLKRFVKTEYISKEKLNVNVQNVAYDGELNVIYMSNYHQFLVVDEDTYNSTYFQLFVLEQYDDTLFEPTILTPLLKIYKMKI